MEKVVFVKSHFAEVGREKSVEVPTGEVKKGLFGGEKQVKKKETI